MNFEGRRLTDERGQTYELERELGRGGQGAVYAAKGGRRAIKILFDRSSKQRQLLRGQLQNIRQMHELQRLGVASRDCKLNCVKGQKLRSNELLNLRHEHHDLST